MFEAFALAGQFVLAQIFLSSVAFAIIAIALFMRNPLEVIAIPPVREDIPTPAAPKRLEAALSF